MRLKSKMCWMIALYAGVSMAQYGPLSVQEEEDRKLQEAEAQRFVLLQNQIATMSNNVVHMFDLVEDPGTPGIIWPEGIFTEEKYQCLQQLLVQDFNKLECKKFRVLGAGETCDHQAEEGVCCFSQAKLMKDHARLQAELAKPKTPKQEAPKPTTETLKTSEPKKPTGKGPPEY